MRDGSNVSSGEYATCPHCGTEWQGWKASETMYGPSFAISVCCGSSAEYLALINAEPKTALSVKLAEYEHNARIGIPLPSPDTLALISVLRQYMAHVEEIRGKVNVMIDSVRR